MIQDRINQEILDRRDKIREIVGNPESILSWVALEKQRAKK